ncbi:hypothetical protein AB0J21_03075 [Streptomyces sp. NPDC049954]|uniref:hypothetical protein n=1 Tax=Streptomyces sp. NPDC049954 TaxID=3155779 RepID=UPI003437AEE1
MADRFTNTTRHARPTTVPRECEGAACGSGGADRARDLAAAGTRLCPTCRLRLMSDLRRLPRLHEECGQLLTGVDRPRDRTSGGPLPGMAFNTAAAEARSQILGTLRCWTSLVVGERGAAAPPDTPAALVAALFQHIDWLLAHRAAGDLTREVRRCVRRAGQVIDPAPRHRLQVGDCVEPGCRGSLAAVARAGAAGTDVEIGCDADPAHRWSGRQWLRLGGRAAERPEPEVRWLAARDIAALWGLAPGSVYRRAGEDGWRRRALKGRTYYHQRDVESSLGTGHRTE